MLPKCFRRKTGDHKKLCLHTFDGIIFIKALLIILKKVVDGTRLLYHISYYLDKKLHVFFKT